MIEQFYNSTVQQSNNQTFQQINNSTIQQFNNSVIQKFNKFNNYDEVKNLVKYFEDSKPKKHLTGNHEPQSRMLRNGVKSSNLTKSVLSASIDLKDRCNFEESRAIFSPGKRKLDISNEPFQLGISQTPKKRRENRS